MAPSLPAHPPPALAPVPALPGASPPEAKEAPFTVLEAIDEFIRSRELAGRASGTLDSYRGIRRAIAENPLASVPAAEATPADIEAFRAWRRERSWKTVRRPGEVKDPNVTEVARPVSNATVNRALMVIGGTFNRLVKLGRLRENRARAVAVVGEQTTARFERYLEGSARLFREGVLCLVRMGMQRVS